MIGSVAAALLPWILSSRVAPIYAAVGADLPGLTAGWLRWWPVSWLLPLGVGAVWWRLRGHPDRGTLTAVAGALGAMAVDGVSVLALWLPLLRLGDLA